MYEYNARILSVVDGGTVDVDIDFGFDVHKKQRLRIFNIVVPEISGETREAGLIVKMRLQSILEVGKKVMVLVRKDKEENGGGYVAEFIFDDNKGDTVNLSDLLFGDGLVKKI